MLSLMFNETRGILERNFVKAHFDSRNEVGWTSHSVCPMIFKETNYFGDPALKFEWYKPTFQQSPANESSYVKVYSSWLNITVYDEDDKSSNVSFYWGDGTYITTNNSVNSGSTVKIKLSDYNLSQWFNESSSNWEWRKFLNHSTTYSWYCTKDNGTSNVTSDTWNFNTSANYDIKEDGTINLYDISGFVNDYGSTGLPGGLIKSDINEDGEVDIIDASAIVNKYGETY